MLANTSAMLNNPKVPGTHPGTQWQDLKNCRKKVGTHPMFLRELFNSSIFFSLTFKWY